MPCWLVRKSGHEEPAGYLAFEDSYVAWLSSEGRTKQEGVCRWEGQDPLGERRVVLTEPDGEQFTFYPIEGWTEACLRRARDVMGLDQSASRQKVSEAIWLVLHPAEDEGAARYDDVDPWAPRSPYYNKDLAQAIDDAFDGYEDHEQQQ